MNIDDTAALLHNIIGLDKLTEAINNLSQSIPQNEEQKRSCINCDSLPDCDLYKALNEFIFRKLKPMDDDIDTVPLLQAMPRVCGYHSCEGK